MESSFTAIFVDNSKLACQMNKGFGYDLLVLYKWKIIGAEFQLNCFISGDFIHYMLIEPRWLILTEDVIHTVPNFLEESEVEMLNVCICPLATKRYLDLSRHLDHREHHLKGMDDMFSVIAI